MADTDRWSEKDHARPRSGGHRVIEPEQHEVAGPQADDTDGERPVHPATAA
jgi:hypothetical protein